MIIHSGPSLKKCLVSLHCSLLNWICIEQWCGKGALASTSPGFCLNKKTEMASLLTKGISIVRLPEVSFSLFLPYCVLSECRGAYGVFSDLLGILGFCFNKYWRKTGNGRGLRVRYTAFVKCDDFEKNVFNYEWEIFFQKWFYICCSWWLKGVDDWSTVTSWGWRIE